MAAVEITMVKPNVSPGGKTLNLKNPTAAAYLNGTLKPEDVILTKNGSVYVKKFKCRVCQYKAAWESEMIRHEVRVHGLDSAAKKKPLPRPIPNLIPIQNNSNGPGSASSSTAASPSRSATSTPTGPVVTHYKSKSNAAFKTSGASPLKNGNLLAGGLNLSDLEYDKPLTEKDLNEIYSKSCATSSLKDFASLIGTEESVSKSDKFKDSASEFTTEYRDTPKKAPDKVETKPADISDSQADNKKMPDAFKKKNASFFDRLKEKLMVGAGESHNLSCWCGHQSKCLSESVLHQKTHTESANEKNDKSLISGPLISGADLSSTRCQHCRQRCKTSSDLFAHLQSCPEMNKKDIHSNHAADTQQQNGDMETSMNGVDDMPPEEDPMDDEPTDFEEFNDNQEPEKQTNRVFVWNSFLHEKEDGGEDYVDDEFRSRSPASESSLVGFEIAPGIGSVMPGSNEEAAESLKDMNFDVHNVETTTKKVFKCPTCTFWASTASRFHVHVVSHMNVKPFGCSVCPYQSKWKWDVTKHIKLKKERDPTHERAEMRTIDVETGRRNYTKYNRFLTVMRVHEPRLDLSQSAVKTASASGVSNSSNVPLLPKLTPAPSINGDVDVDGACNSANSVGETDMLMRPLPQLHPANPNVGVKRSHESSATEEGEPPKKKVPGEKKMWKCKKCKFRNTDRNIVLTHVKEHYTSNAQKANSSHNFSATDKVSSTADAADAINGENHTSVNGIIRCNLCNFETDNTTTFRIHNSHHVEDPSATFKCCFCPFFANDKQFMINHISTHGVNNPEELVLNAINNEDSYRKDEYDDKMETSADELGTGEMSDGKFDSGNGDEMEIYKRFKCASCPYVTNNKSQYLYHKQFHRVRDAPFKCNICSYNVTKRHLLHQHLKIHGVKRAQFKTCLKEAVETKSVEEDGMKLNTDIDTAHLPDVPLVWVYRAGTITKMFKCRHCPHVNLRKSNIHEHEKMHFDRIQRSPNGSITTGQVSTHHCADCNYVCNNAGALASHAKVHQGAFGQICALVDSRRSDESQIREITRLFKEDERFKKETPSKAESLEKRLMPASVDVPLSPMSNGDATSTTAADSPAPQSQGRTNLPDDRVLHFCNVCPARFCFLKDLESHTRFHTIHHLYKCSSCTYSAPMQAQLLAHKRVHSNEYHEKTNSMCQMHPIAKEFARPRTAHIPDKPGFAGLGWVVVHPTQKKDETPAPGVKPTKTVTKQFSCHKCPAQFFKSVALQHHLSLHGGKDQYQCRGCDYRVKTYGNLIKHEAVHGLEPRVKAKVLKSKKLNFSAGASLPADGPANAFVPSSGTELFQHRSEQLIREQTMPAATSTPGIFTSGTRPPIITPTPPSAAAIAAAGLNADPEFGIFIHGSPDFVYPRTVKNGKLKEKRYKCHKCPSAFEKREQYKTHCTLHGAKSRFRCEKCDYAVKYFANYSQHMRKHDMNERIQLERRANQQSRTTSDECGNEKGVTMSATASSLLSRLMATGEESAADSYSSVVTSPEKSLHSTPLGTPAKAAKTLHISVADQQAVVLMQEKISDFGINMADQLYRCYYCPYSHQRKDAVENHERCHFNPKGTYVCEFCNYTVPQPHFLREHQKLHFGTMKGIKPEAYMKCDRLEIWMETEEGKVCIFKDSGRKENRFEPPVTVNEEDSEFKKMYVDIKTGEECTPCKSEPPFDNNDEELSSPTVSKPVFDSLSQSVSSPMSLRSSPTPSKDEEEADVKLEDAVVKDEPLDEEDEAKMDVDDEDDSKMEDDVEDDHEDVDDEQEDDEDDEEDVEPAENEEDLDADADATVNGVGDEYDYASGVEGSDEFDEEAELDDVDQRETPGPEDDLTDRNGDCENAEESALEEGCEGKDSTIEGDASGAVNATKEESDDSDSEDSESSSSSSSGSGSGSGTSCSSSDSSDDEKEQNAPDSDNEVNPAPSEGGSLEE